MKLDDTGVRPSCNELNAQNDAANSTVHGRSSHGLNRNECAVEGLPSTPERKRRGRPPRPVAERFWEKVRKTDGCWIWIAGYFTTGYGFFNFVGTLPQNAHRVAWTLTNGPIPPDTNVCHRCDNRKCVRPDHLFLGNDVENLRDMTRKGRRKGALRGLAAPRVNFEPAAADAMRDILRDGETPARLAGLLGYRTDTIVQVVDHNLWIAGAP